ncbi:type II secretion system F family protein [Kitasatospora sp. McL0602]|uniref:type II secretion system F family protein n=1 Tax=Kitasatospora sp. McL0602 TaxID=3439530 RepID=UPI003F8B014C
MTTSHALWSLWAVGFGLLGAGLWLGVSGCLRRRRRTRAAERARGVLSRKRRDRETAPGRWAARLRVRRPAWLVAELLLLPVGVVLSRGTRSPVPLVGMAAAVVPLRRWRQRRRSAAEARRRASAVIELCEALAAELRSGATPGHALHVVTTRAGSLRSGLGDEPLARLVAGRYGADIAAALRRLAELPGGRGAAAVAACWHITNQSGAGLAVGLDQVADALRAERALSEEIAGELAAPRTTIAVLAALPAVGLLLGAALGAKPVHVLLHTPAGLACLALGVLLEAAGLLWTGRIIRSAAAAPGGEAPRGWEARGCGLSRIRHGRAEVAG